MPLLKWLPLLLAIALLILAYVAVCWALSLTAEDVKLWMMWIKLFIDGYAEPMRP